MRKKYLFRRRNDWLGRVLVRIGLAPRHKHIPMFGVQGAGKSYFVMSVAQFISQPDRALGRLVGESKDYITRFLPAMLNGERLDATVGYRDIDLEVNRIYQTNFDQVREERPAGGSDILERVRWRRPPSSVTSAEESETSEHPTEEDGQSETIECDFLISTNDLSGAQFKDAMERLSEPTSALGEDPQTRRFLQVLDDGEGAIVIVDVVRREMSPSEFSQERVKHVRRALAEQVVPVARGIELALLKGNQQNRIFPIFLVFPKRDIHQFSRADLNQIVREVFAVQIAAWKDNVKVRIHSVQNMGFGIRPGSKIDLETHSEGIGLFLADLYYWIREM